MNYSISTHCIHSEPLSTALDLLSPYTKYIEVMSEGLHRITSTTELESYNVKYSIHAPFQDVNIAAISEPIRKNSVKQISDTFKIATELGAPVIIHPGYYSSEPEYELSKRQLQLSLSQIKKEADNVGVTYYIENMGDWGMYFLKNPTDLKLINDTGSAFCLDIGHANNCGNLNQFLIHKFGHVHLHDNNGDNDSHNPIGNGNIDFDLVMKRVIENNIKIPVIEVSTIDGAIESLNTLKQRYG
ncbi:MAG TPA: sugar phosphate isomerase/epimerase [Methanocorpusculum sp.]|nr:sugar phosphate isomerase/epimerase [Methanocorpusculum sp.]